MVALGLWVSDDVPLELLLHLQHSLELSASIAPLMPRRASSQQASPQCDTSHRCDAGLLSPLPSDWVDAIDYGEVLDAMRIPHPSQSSERAEAADAGRRLLRLASHTHYWSRQMVIDLAASVEGLHSPWRSDKGEAARTELRNGLQQAVYLGCAAVVLPPLTEESHHADEIPDDAVAFVEELAHIAVSSSSQTKLWLPCAPTVASWTRWNALRLRLAAAESLHPDGHGRSCRLAGGAAVARFLQPILQRDGDSADNLMEDDDRCCVECCRVSRRIATPNCWLGESIACYVLDELDGEALAGRCCSTAMLWGFPVADTNLCNHHCGKGSNGAEGFDEAMGSRQAPAAGEPNRRGGVPCCTPGRGQWIVEMARRGVLLVLKRPLFGGESFSQAERVSDDLRTFWTALRQHVVPHMMLPSLDRLRHVEDALHVPLQPLCDNLENAVYTTFEADRIKYEQYGAALRRYFRRHSISSLPVYVVLLGAGRGPLITEILLAATDADVAVHIVAIEKSYAAVAHLRLRQRFDSGWRQLLALGSGDSDATCNQLTVVHADGREAFCNLVATEEGCGDEGTRAVEGKEAFVKASLIVSELLGSAGDNELAPECVEGVRNQIMAARGEYCRRGRCGSARCVPGNGSGSSSTCGFPALTCIPQSCTFWVAPLQSATLVDKIDALACAGHHVPGRCPTDASSVRESMWLSHIVNGRCLAPPQQAWTFDHSYANGVTTVAPSSDSNSDRASRDTVMGRQLVADVQGSAASSFFRSCTLRFEVPVGRCRVDAIAGYFTAVLMTGCRQDGDATPVACSEDDNCDADIVLSTVPLSWTRGMVSWFPCVLPLRQSLAPGHGSDKTEVLVRLCRKGCEGGIYYQWAVSSVSVPGSVLDDEDSTFTSWHNEGGAHWKMSL